MSRFIKPDARYEVSHASFIAEMLELGEELVPWVLEEVGDDFEAYLLYLERQSQGVGLQPGFVPSSTFWLLGDSDEIVAISNLRHVLTEHLSIYGGHIGFGVRPSARLNGHATEVLRQTVLRARQLGIGDILVTCDKGNIGSSKAIRRNGGEYSGEEFIDACSSIVQRYWIRSTSVL